MRNRERNKYQKQLTKMLRAWNKSIEEDELWLGRFYVMQRRTLWFEFPSQIWDKEAGGIMNVQIRVYDRETNYYKDYMLEYAPYLCTTTSRIFRIINDFIVKDLGVWELDPRPQFGKTKDYCGQKYMQNDSRPDNFHLGYDDIRKGIEPYK